MITSEVTGMRRWMLVLGPVVALGACAPNYVYQPAEHATAQIAGRAAAQYQIPPAYPQGDVRLASFGFSKISPTHAPDEQERAVHVRMVVANNGSRPWTVDTREQRLDLPGQGLLPPAFVQSSGGTGSLPFVTVPAGSERTLDLFYPLPPDLQKAKHIPEFDLVWRVRTPQTTVTERTPFDRLRVVPVYATGYGPGWTYYRPWGGPYWYDPWYPVGLLPQAYVGAPVVIGAPSWGVPY